MKKNVRADSYEGISSKPLFISDWTNDQLEKYCDACGIEFSDSLINKANCLYHICQLEQARGSPSEGQAET